ncbi:putative phage abortive infection protein [Chryseobacterium mucoviscidosis]|uniref:putative phage abortive infection protein n=1 Tax=Chryseobacterium mucoviscidosis TaxID=1945581 RepID=UPI0031D5DDCC
MTTITIIISILCFCITIYTVYKISDVLFRMINKDQVDEFKTHLSKEDIWMVLIACIFILISFCTPFVLTRSSITDDFNFTNTGQIGDTIGGLMSPFINLSAVIVTGLAFYMQYKANKLQVKIFRKQLEETQNQFKSEQEKQDKNSRKQQFESQFYEMLRLHKENVNEIEIDAKQRIEKIEAPVTKDDRPKVYYEYLDYKIAKRNAFVEMLKELEFLISKLELSDSPKLTLESYKNIYEIFFWGLAGYESLEGKFPESSSRKFEDILYHIQSTQYSKEIFTFNTGIPFNIPAFAGHSNFLGHYYRHLFHTVKFVVSYDPEILTEDEKMNFLRLLRAQLSNHEQALLFYNWLSEYGGNWENDTNQFFTKYKMIHNLT